VSKSWHTKNLDLLFQLQDAEKKMSLLRNENATYEAESAALQRRMDVVENQDTVQRAGKALKRSELQRYGLNDPVSVFFKQGSRFKTVLLFMFVCLRV
jgi:hypothetical protein